METTDPTLRILLAHHLNQSRPPRWETPSARSGEEAQTGHYFVVARLHTCGYASVILVQEICVFVDAEPPLQAHIAPEI